MTLAISLLGGFQVSLDGRPLNEFYSVKVRALLAYLAVEPEREHPRSLLATLLWPEWDDSAALGNLRFSLSKLRQAIDDQNAAPPFLLIQRESLRLNPAADASVDVHLFRQALRASSWEAADVEGVGLSTVQRAARQLSQAIESYGGPFLDGFTVSDSVAFEEWAQIQRQQLEQEMLRSLHGLAGLYARCGDYVAADRAIRRLLGIDPWDERANRRLMSVLAQQGLRNAALRHYLTFREELTRELGCEPEDETQALYAQIRDEQRIAPQSSPASPTERAGQGSIAAVPLAPAMLLDHAGQEGSSDRTQPSPGFVSREQELARLHRCCAQALSGQGGVALIAGEAGSGKTALLDEFARQAGQTYPGLMALQGSCSSHAGAGDPYLPFREILRTLAGDVEGKRAGGTLSLDQAQRSWEALPVVAAALVEHGPDLIDRFVPGEALLRRVEAFPGPPGAARWLPQLREIVHRARETAAPTFAQVALAPQPDLFAQVTQVLHSISTRWPLLVVIDDLQWTDGGTEALLFHLGRRLAGSRILLVCAFRTEDLQAAPHPQSRPLEAVLRELTREWGDILINLDDSDGRAFVAAYVDREPNGLGEAFRRALYERTAGNPLFTSELLSSFKRAGELVQDEAGRWVEAAGLDWGRCPPQVEAVILSHLAQLSDKARTLLRAASIQGERFTAEVTARVLGWDEEAVVRGLSGSLRTRHRLVEAVSLDRLAASGRRLSHYRFRHALVQHSAYHSLDAVARARLHEATARALETIYADTEEAQALQPELARHYEAAGLPLEGARRRLQAGHLAVRLLAYDQAITHFERGLALLESAAASPERLRLEIALCLALIVPASLRFGWRAPTLTQVLDRIINLCQYPDLQDDPQRFVALSLLAVATNWSGDPGRGQQVAEQLLKLAGHDARGDRQSRMLAHLVMGQSLSLRGELSAARQHLNQALALADSQKDLALGMLFSGEPGVVASTLLSMTLWLLGYPEQGRASLLQALAQCSQPGKSSSAAVIHLMGGVIDSILARDVSAAQQHGSALQGLGQTSVIYRAWVKLFAGQAGAAGAQPGLEHSLATATEAGSDLQASGAGVGHDCQLLVRAQLLARAGQPGMALEAVIQAQGWIEQTGVCMMEAEVRRMHGELLLALDPANFSEAESCFRQALQVAQAQQARWYELRTAVSLARLWQVHGRSGEARELLAGIYAWFTEGYDQADLVEARAVLQQLSQ